MGLEGVLFTNTCFSSLCSKLLWQLLAYEVGSGNVFSLTSELNIYRNTSKLFTGDTIAYFVAMFIVINLIAIDVIIDEYISLWTTMEIVVQINNKRILDGILYPITIVMWLLFNLI